MHKRSNSQLPTIVSVVSTVILLVITLIWFNSSIGVKVTDINETYLIENTRALASVFRAKLDDQLIMLESQVRYFEDIDLSDYNAMKETIMSTRGIGAFRTIGAADASGATINYNGKSSGNIMMTDMFRHAMDGESYVSKYIYTDENGDDVLMVGIPIKQKGRAVGVIYGTFGKDMLARLINTSGFTPNGTALLLDAEGDIISASENVQTSLFGIKNFFDGVGFPKPSKNTDTVRECYVGDTESIVVVTSVGVHDWHFVSVLPKSVVNKQSDSISGDVLILVAFVSFAFVLMFMSVMYLLKSNDDILRTNERFKFVTSEAQDLVFDYDFKRQTLTLDGSIEELTGDPARNEFGRLETLGFLGRIHDEDSDFRDRIINIRCSTDTSVRAEFRLKCADESYSWFRVKGTVVRGSDGAAQRFIGSLINADDQMNRDLRLIEKAETDPLTGIFTKSAFYSHVSTQLRSASDSDLFAVYIIDLDNFKLINDDLGHQMGDQVLSDVAKKLCVVFNEKDYVGRIGGDEFAAFLHLSSKARNVGMTLIEGKAKAICDQIRETYRSKNKEVCVTASVGVAIYPYAGRDYNTLYRKADKALSKVKSSGKNSFGICSPEDEN